MDNLLVLDLYQSNTEQHGISQEYSLETLIALCVYKFCNLPDIQLQYMTKNVQNIQGFTVKHEDLLPINIVNPSNLPWQVTSCKLPAVMIDSTIITGMCAVSRHLCKCRKSQLLDVEHPKGILGFRSSCLQAPNEVSVWTKFCEIEILETTKDLLKHIVPNCHLESKDSFEIPKNLARFEKHLNQPLRIHNVYKMAREVANKSYIAEKMVFENSQVQATGSSERNVQRKHIKYRKWKSNSKPVYIDSSIPIDKLDLEHIFAEGPFLTLADLILYPCYTIIDSILGNRTFEKYLPKTNKWFNNIKSLREFDQINSFLSTAVINVKSKENYIEYTMPEVQDVSLYKCDPKRSNPKKRLFTKENDVESALNLISEDVKLLNLTKPETNETIDWSSIPSDANPNGGHLPDTRMVRKTQQLENVALSVMKLAHDGNKIIDFCSGSGHLGILLAYLLPKCTIILLENKEESLNRAKARVLNLGLKNIVFFQCNLDYFIGEFDIGVALHACGIATDLVLDNCIKQNASFVVCPCCYGSLHVTERLQYPRSKHFSNIPLDKYICIGHAADQTHVDHPMEERGTKCMTIIDSDRAQHAMDNGYSVQLSRLKPLSCTPKNMLIVGVAGV